MKKNKHGIRILAGLFCIILTGCGPMQESKDSQERIQQEAIVIQQKEPEVVILQEKNQPEETEPESEPEIKEPLHLLFGGDVLLSDHVLNAYQQSGGIQGVLDDGYRQKISEADFFMVNQEFPFSSRGTQAPNKQYTFRLPPEKVSLFTEMSIDGVTLANNHALDFGQEALLDTCQILDDAGILHTGAGASLDEAKKAFSVEWNQKKIAFIGATRVIPVADWAAGKNHPGMLATYNPTVLVNEIQSLSETQDLVIVFVHWGIEREEMPEAYQRELAKQYIDAGADLVIGSHPHVLQGIEFYKGTPIVYSLGNFVFGSSIPKTMLLEAEVSEENEIRLRVVPGTSKNGYTRKLTDASELQEFYKYLESISFGVSYQEDGSVLEK